MPYNPAAAIAYAHRWAFARNPRHADFSDLGGDCTNFISQCLNAGGFAMNYTPNSGWFYTSLDSRSPSWSGVEELYAFAISNRGDGPQAVVGEPTQVQPGDVIQLSFDGTAFAHSLFVVGHDASGTPLVATHTYDSDNRPLSSYMYSKARAMLFNRE
ncbi:MAG: amidase domain-containing protein [Oscillospiraceae bacterium]|jgi:hypothetical protein|nr:amidase domain-containing protein [Oscillospiraceae bacterium]